MSDGWIIIAVGAVFTLFLGRSAIIAFWPESDAAKFCETHLDLMDGGSDCDGDGGDGGGD